MYMCQFPFDLDEARLQDNPDHLSSYQTVVVNSVFSLYWYNQYVYTTLRTLRAKGKPFPAVQVLHPAVDPVKLDPKQLLPPAARWTIVLLGRIFEGRQSKGHDLAIDLFRQLREKLPSGAARTNVKLALIGNPATGEVSTHLYVWIAHISMPTFPPTHPYPPPYPTGEVPQEAAGDGRGGRPDRNLASGHQREDAGASRVRARLLAVDGA